MVFLGCVLYFSKLFFTIDEVITFCTFLSFYHIRVALFIVFVVNQVGLTFVLLLCEWANSYNMDDLV